MSSFLSVFNLKTRMNDNLLIISDTIVRLYFLMIYFFGTKVCYANHDIQNAEYDKGNKCLLCLRIVMQAYDFVARKMPIMS